MIPNAAASGHGVSLPQVTILPPNVNTEPLGCCAVAAAPLFSAVVEVGVC